MHLSLVSMYAIPFLPDLNFQLIIPCTVIDEFHWPIHKKSGTSKFSLRQKGTPNIYESPHSPQ